MPMISSNLRSVAFLLMLIICEMANAQNYKIAGQVIDDATISPIPHAAVTLLAADSTMIKATIANENGEYVLMAEKKGSYILKFSFLGMVTQIKSIKVQGKTTNVQMVRMKEDENILQNVEVTGNIPKVQVVEDTIMYNADAYRLPEGSVLEELIERIPGAEVDEEGNVTINGRKVKKILVDGKEFFIGDMASAVKNIPTNIVKRIKHYQKKSDLARLTGIDDGQEEPVIDVEIKKGMKKGYNINGDMGYGTHKRYFGKMNVNSFTKDMKISGYINGNNANNRATPNRSGNGRGNASNATSSSSTANGLKSNKSMGVNLSYDNNQDMQIDGNVRWRHSDSDRSTISSSESFVSKSGAFGNGQSHTFNRNDGWNADFKIEWDPSEEWNVIIRPTASISNQDKLTSSRSANFNADPYIFVQDPLDDGAYFGDADSIRLNSRVNSSMSYTQKRNAGASVQVNRRLGKKGRNITLRAEGSYSETKNEQITNNIIHLYKVKDADGNDSTYYTNRYNTAPSKTKSYSLQATYSEPVMNAVFLQLSYRFSYNNNYSDRDTYDFSMLRDAFGRGIAPAYRTWDEYLYSASQLVDVDSCLSKSLSRYSEYFNYTHDVNLALKIIRDNYNISVGLRYMPVISHFRQDYHGYYVDTVRNTTTITPTFSFRYRFSKQHTLNISYQGQTSQPSITQLLDITDDSNPLNISKGNPALKPSFTNTFQLRYNDYIMDRRQSVSANVDFSTTSNSISNKVTYNESTGGRTTQPENINGNWNVAGNFLFTSAIDKDSKWNMSTSTDARYNHYVSYVALNKKSDSEKNVTKTTTLSERLSGSYRNSWLEVEVNGRVNYISARNALQESSNMDVWNYSYGCSFNVTLPWGMILDTSINQTCRSGYSNAAFNTSELIWNAQISQQLLPKKRLMLTLQFYDILNKQSNLSRQIDANRRSDSWTNGINSYAMLHVLYKYGHFGKKKKSSKQAKNKGKQAENSKKS